MAMLASRPSAAARRRSRFSPRISPTGRSAERRRRVYSERSTRDVGCDAARAVFLTDEAAERRRRASCARWSVPPAQPRGRRRAAARRGALRPDPLPQRADLLRREERESGGGVARVGAAPRRAADPRCIRPPDELGAAIRRLCRRTAGARQGRSSRQGMAPQASPAPGLPLSRRRFRASRMPWRPRTGRTMPARRSWSRLTLAADPLDAEAYFVRGTTETGPARSRFGGRLSPPRPVHRPDLWPGGVPAGPRARASRRPSGRAAGLRAGAAHPRGGERSASRPARRSRRRRIDGGLPEGARLCLIFGPADLLESDHQRKEVVLRLESHAAGDTGGAGPLGAALVRQPGGIQPGHRRAKEGRALSHPVAVSAFA